MINKKLAHTRGFTLIETMVAVLLLSIAIAGPLTIASKGLSSALVAKDQIGAYYLAQDAVEYARFKRDSNRLAGVSWLTGLVGAGLCSADGTTACKVDSVQDTVSACSGTCPALNYDNTNHFYTYATADGTTVVTPPEHFIRTITVQTPVGTNVDEAALSVTVQWTGAGGLLHSVTLREDLFNWQ